MEGGWPPISVVGDRYLSNDQAIDDRPEGRRHAETRDASHRSETAAIPWPVTVVTIPAIHGSMPFIADGGLMYYGANTPDLYRRAATYVDKILRGAKPAELPVEQPMKFDFVINFKAANKIGLTVPPNALAWADRVINKAKVKIQK